MSVLVLAAPAAVAQAQTQWRPPPVAPAYGRGGYDEGYRRGEQLGLNDGRRGSAFNFTMSPDYRRGDIGYGAQFGSRDRYRTDFRAGFEAGYRSGFARFGRSGNGRPGRGGNAGHGNRGYGYGGYDLASSNGYADGYEEGLNDGRKRHTNDPQDESRATAATVATSGSTARGSSTARTIAGRSLKGMRAASDGWQYR